MPNWSIQPSYINDYMNNNAPLPKVSYVVPMTGAASVAATAAMQNNAVMMGQNSIESALQDMNNKMTEAVNMARYNVQQAEDKADKVVKGVAFGGMSLWFLVAAAIVLIILFSGRV